MDKVCPCSLLPTQCFGHLLARLPGSMCWQELHRLCLWRETQQPGGGSRPEQHGVLQVCDKEEEQGTGPTGLKNDPGA